MTSYRGDDTAPLQQGDVLFGPVVRLAVAGSASGGVIPPPLADLPPVRAELVWGPCVIVAHDCLLDKEFNDRYRELRRTGSPKKEAVQAAEADPSLDRWLTVAQVRPVTDADRADAQRAQRLEAIKAGNVVGAFHLPRASDRGIEEGVLDLTAVSTIDRHLVQARLASLNEDARTSLRYAIARAGALRTPTLGFELEDIIGDRIERAEKTADNPSASCNSQAVRHLEDPPGPPSLQ